MVLGNKSRYVNWDAESVQRALEVILNGVGKRIDLEATDIKVYECKNIIRIDVKVHESQL